MLGRARASPLRFALRMAPEAAGVGKGTPTPLRKLRGAVGMLQGPNDERRTKLLGKLCVVSGEGSSVRSKRQDTTQRGEATSGPTGEVKHKVRRGLCQNEGGS